MVANTLLHKTLGGWAFSSFPHDKMRPKSPKEMAKWLKEIERLDNESIQLMLQLKWQLGKQPHGQDNYPP